MTDDGSNSSGPAEMKVALYADNTLALPLAALCGALDDTCEQISFTPGTVAPRIASSVLHGPTTAQMFADDLAGEPAAFDLAVVATSVPYDNNYFFESLGSPVVVSFSGWNQLTDLPVSNGVVYFLALLILRDLGIGASHDETTGCVNDFGWDKSAIDYAMRAAYVCRDCSAQLATTNAPASQVADATRLLDLVSRASRAHRDVLEAASPRKAGASTFDVFMCHNSEDKPAVREVTSVLRDAGLRPWIDEEHLPIGQPWQPELEQIIDRIASAAVFVGPSGLGPWQSVEVRAFLAEFVGRACPVVPVLLPDSTAAPTLPMFLRQMTWVDLRTKYDDGIRRLADGLPHAT
jgi:hypothetical protein